MMMFLDSTFGGTAILGHAVATPGIVMLFIETVE